MNEKLLKGGLSIDLEKSFGAMDECVIITRPDRCILFANQAVEKTFGFKRDALIGKSSKRLFAEPADYDASGRIFQEKASTTADKFTILFRRKNGQTFTAEVVATALYDSENNHLGFLSVARDITDRLALESRLSDTAMMLEDALETISEGFALYDQEDRLIICNEKYRQIYSHSAPAMKPGATFRDILNYGLDRNEYELGTLSRDEWLQIRFDRHMKADGRIIEQPLGDGTWLQIAERKTQSGGRAGIRTDITALKQAQAQAEKAHHDLTDLADNLSCSITEVDLEGRCLFINKVGAQWFGMCRSEMLGIKIRNLLSRSNRAKTDSYYKRALAGEHMLIESPVRFPDGIIREVAIEYSPKRNAQGEQTGLVIFATDITDRKTTERTLADLYSITSTRELGTDEKIQLILKLGCEHFGLPFGIISHIVDNHYQVIYAESPNDEVPVGASFELGETYCYHTLKTGMPLAIAHTKHSELEAHPCYKKFALETYIGAPLLVDGQRYGTINFTSSTPRQRPFTQTDRELIRQFADWVGNEIARQKDHDALIEAQIRLERIASIDDLTGILNRRAFLERAATEVARFRRTGRKFTAVLLDIDHFKMINDTHGHAIGDDVLKRFSEIALNALRVVDVFGRVGGEEFCVILDGTDKESALMVCERLREAITAKCRVEPIAWDITCSMGIATISDEDVDFSTVLQRADNALYKAKDSGRNCCVVYQNDSESRITID